MQTFVKTSASFLSFLLWLLFLDYKHIYWDGHGWVELSLSPNVWSFRGIGYGSCVLFFGFKKKVFVIFTSALHDVNRMLISRKALFLADPNFYPLKDLYYTIFSVDRNQWAVIINLTEKFSIYLDFLNYPHGYEIILWHERRGEPSEREGVKIKLSEWVSCVSQIFHKYKSFTRWVHSPNSMGRTQREWERETRFIYIGKLIK